MPFSTLVQLVGYLRGEIAAPEYNYNKAEAVTANDYQLAVDLAHIKR